MIFLAAAMSACADHYFIQMLDQEIYIQLIHGLEQQLWFFGQDTKDRGNNLFEQHGFKRYRTPGHGGSSRYRKVWRGRTVDLHSFCVGIYGGSKDGFLFVRAFDEAYAYLGQKPPLPGRYRKKFLQLPSDEESTRRFFEASCDFFEWLEHYENWVDETFGKGYRLDCFVRYHRKWISPDKARNWFQKYRKLESSTKIFQTA